jgi:hypothetical protein
VAQLTNSEPKIIIYFMQVTMIIVGPSTASIAWYALELAHSFTPCLRFGLVNFNVFYSTTACVLPLGPLQKLGLGVWIPVFCCLLLGLTFVLHVAGWWLLYGRHDNHSSASSKFKKFHRSNYVRSFVGLVLFSHNSLTSTVFTYFNCVEVNGYGSFIAEYPAVDCEGEAYSRW